MRAQRPDQAARNARYAAEARQRDAELRQWLAAHPGLSVRQMAELHGVSRGHMHRRLKRALA